MKPFSIFTLHLLKELN